MKTWMWTAVLVVLAGASAWAQDSDADRRARFLKERLGLDEEQSKKAAEIYKQNAESEKKLEEDRRAKLREILTDEQKAKYDEMIKEMQAPGGRGPGGAAPGPGGRGMGGGGFNFVDRFLDGLSDQLKEQLGLDEEQLGKAKTLIDELKKKAQENIEELRKNGFAGVDWQEEMKKWQERMKETTEKMKAFLTDEQKAKLDKLVEEMQNRGMGGGFGGGRREDRGAGGPGRATPEERVKRAMEALKIEKADEAAAVKDLVAKVVEALHALEVYDREARTKVDELRKDAKLSDEELQNKIDEIRKGRDGKNAAVKDAQKGLYEVVTARQELELIQQGLLR